MSNKDFYRAFEDKHRGSRELIKNRLTVYLPFITPLKEVYSDCIALDIGCGRGEWLELLKENTINSQGIDYDKGMLQACHDIGLDVRQGNGIAYLKNQPDESLMIVSAFHVVEHISFEDLQSLIQEALRVLKPGGILIMETPNPENIKVATESFYLDPTHIKPIPSGLLSFLPEYFGYIRSKILKLQEPRILQNKDDIGLLDVLGGVSPDYAVIAQKDAPKKILNKFNQEFNKEYGVSLTSLTEKFENRLLDIEARATEAEARATEAEAKATEAEAKATEAEARATEAMHRYHLTINSTSWKITKPLRYLGDKYKWFKANVKAWITLAPGSRPRRVVKHILLSLKHRIEANPKLKYNLVKILNKFPKLKERLKKIAKANHHAYSYIAHANEIDKLSPRAEKIYNDLKKAIEEQRGHK